MPGCNWGFSVSAEFTVASTDPLDRDHPVRPDELARAIQRQLKGTICTTSVGDHTINDIHIYRVSPTLASIRRAFGMDTPWIDKTTGKVLPLPALTRAARATPGKGPAAKGPAVKAAAPKKPSPKAPAKKKK